MGEILVPQRQENMSRKVVGLNPDADKKNSSLNMCNNKLVWSACCDVCAINIWEMYNVMFFSRGRCTPNVNKNNKTELLTDFLIVKQTKLKPHSQGWLHFFVHLVWEAGFPIKIIVIYFSSLGRGMPLAEFKLSKNCPRRKKIRKSQPRKILEASLKLWNPSFSIQINYAMV